MYGTIPDVVISKPPRNNQFRVVVALVVGVLIGALGTAMLFPVATKLTPALYYHSDIEWVPAVDRDHVLREYYDECRGECSHQDKECESDCENSCENIYERLLAHE